MTSIRLKIMKIRHFWYTSKSCKVQRLGPWVCFCWGCLGEHSKNIELSEHHATTPPRAACTVLYFILGGRGTSLGQDKQVDRSPTRMLCYTEVAGGGVHCKVHAVPCSPKTWPVSAFWSPKWILLHFGLMRQAVYDKAGSCLPWLGIGCPIIQETREQLEGARGVGNHSECQVSGQTGGCALSVDVGVRLVGCC